MSLDSSKNRITKAKFLKMMFELNQVMEDQMYGGGWGEHSETVTELVIEEREFHAQEAAMNLGNGAPYTEQTKRSHTET